jgi:glycosyltransferase involved in cell wall biosynthesis
MFEGHKVVVVMPAYNAARTLERTFHDVSKEIVDETILCDDCSQDHTVEVAKRLGIEVIEHRVNKGYGANQKSCYDLALARGADIIVMIHPDYQYDPRVVPFAVGFVAKEICDVVIGSRIRTRAETLKGGMPVYKYISNRILSGIENVVLGQNLGDCHSGFRVYKREVLEKVDYHVNSDGFVFDTQFLAQAVYYNFRLGDIPIPTRYFQDASSISFRNSVVYGLKTLGVMVQFLLQKIGFCQFSIFKSKVNQSERIAVEAAARK